MTPTLKVTRVRRAEQPLPLPHYQTELAAGMDLYADLETELTLGSLERGLVPTGLCIELPPGYEAQIRPRSGLALKFGLTCLNSPGTIDADYRGELKVLLVNLSTQAATLRRGDRVAQLIVAPVARAKLHEVGALSDSSRGVGGFGSTGI